MAAAPLLHVFEKADASLSLAETRLEGEASTAFAAHPHLNPARLLKRLAAIEADLPKLREAAEKNATARRSVLGTLHAQQAANQSAAMSLAQRAHAPVGEDNATFEMEHNAARDLDFLFAAAASVSNVSGGGGIEQHTLAAAPTDVSSAPSASARQPPPAVTIAAPHAIDELTWLRLSPTHREAVSLEDVNTFWRVLRGLFVKRETHELQAAQLLALGVRTTGDNARKLRILDALGLVKLQSNAVHLL